MNEAEKNLLAYLFLKGVIGVALEQQSKELAPKPIPFCSGGVKSLQENESEFVLSRKQFINSKTK